MPNQIHLGSQFKTKPSASVCMMPPALQSGARNKRTGSLQALYRGNGANVLRLVPEVALKFGLNDQLKILFTPADGGSMSFSRKLAAGATAGVLKVRTQPSRCSKDSGKHHAHELCCDATISTA